MFSWIKSAFERKSASLAYPDSALFDLFGIAATTAGEPVTPQTAMGVPAVNAAVSLISNAVSSLDVKIFQDAPDGTRTSAPSHPANPIVFKRANSFQSASAFRKQLQQDALLYGAGYGLAGRDSEGNVAEFLRLPPLNVEVLFDTYSEPSFLFSQPTGGQVTYSHQDILYIPATTIDGYHHMAPILAAREAIALMIRMNKHAAQLFANGAQPGGVLSFPGTLTDIALSRIKESFQRNHGGRNSGGIAIADQGGKLDRQAFTGVESQFAELWSFLIEEIARAFGVPSTFLGKLDRATWSNSEQMAQQLLTFCLAPWLKVWEGAYEHVLSLDDDANYSVEFLVDDLLRTDLATQANALAQLRAAGLMTGNEGRQKLNLPARPDGDSLANPNTTSGAPTFAPTVPVNSQ